MKEDDIERLLDNAACASQCRELLRDDDNEETALREAIRTNVVVPLLRKIKQVEDENLALRRLRRGSR